MRDAHEEDEPLTLDYEASDVVEAGEAASKRRRDRDPLGIFDQWPHVLNLANCIVGVSVLAMPFCFQQCGIILGVLLIGICSVLTKLTCYYLSKGASMYRTRSYETFAEAAMGRPGRRAVEILMLLFLISAIVAFMVVIGDIGPHLASEFLEMEAPTHRLRILVMVLVLLFIILPLSIINNIDTFAPMSTISILFYFLFVVRMIWESLPRLLDGSWTQHVRWWRPEGFLTSLPIVTMALSCQTQLFSVIDSMREASSKRVDVVVAGAVNICSAVYAAVGLFGYVAFHDEHLHGDVLVRLSSSSFTQLLKLCFMLSVAVSIPLMLFPARVALFNLCLRPADCELPQSALQRSTFHILTFVILVFNLLLAILIPNVEFILGLTGSFVGSLTSIILPSILFIVVASSKGHPSVPYAKACLVAGIFILLASTWATLHGDLSSTVADKVQPKKGEVRDLESLERLEERVLDSNINISAKLDNLAIVAAKADEKVAQKILLEVKEQQQEQEKLLKKQEDLVEKLNIHHEQHRKEEEERSKKESVEQGKTDDAKQLKVE